MAEARSIASLGGESTKPVLLKYSQDGLHFDVHVRIPPPKEVVRVAKLRVLGLGNALSNSVFPLHPLAVGSLMLLGVALVVAAGADSWFRQGWLAQLVWSTAAFLLPSLQGLPLSIHLIILASLTTFIIVMLIATLQRCLLRVLLRYKGFLYQARNPSVAVRVWGLLMKLLVGSNRKHRLYNFQGVLPSLPVPSLADTCQRYLNAVNPLQTPEQFAVTTALAAEFQSGVGKRLQRYLNFKSWYASNYVTDWWEKYVYLNGRSPIAINSNYYVLTEAEFVPTTVPEARMAVTLVEMMRYRDLLDSEQLQPTVMAGGLVPLCMEQFRRIFSTTRLPGRECDVISHASASSASLHVVVMCAGSMYRMEVVRSGGSPASAAEFEAQLVAIKQDALARTPDAAEARLPALTAENRTRWAEIRETYFAEGVNRRSLNTIESALLVLHLDVDSEDTHTWTGRGKALLHGSGSNRWFDKSLNFVVFKNGHAGLNAEHSFADAPVVAHLFEVVIIAADKNTGLYDATGHAVPITSGSSCSRETIIPWQRITWSLPRPAEEAVHAAFGHVRELISDIDLQVSSYKKYGKGFMKKCNVSPDAFIQMAMQLAYFKDSGTFHATYEASMTRLFLHGRTETVRPVSGASCAFVRAMSDPSASPAQKLKALQDAAAHHQTSYQDAMSGKGLDRHLFALYIVSKGMGVDSPFLKAALGEPWRLSTSQQPQCQTGLWDPRDPKDQHLISPGGGFGPVSDDGYGVSYMVAKEDETFFHVSSKRSCPKTDSSRFLMHLSSAFDDMAAILPKTNSKKTD